MKIYIYFFWVSKLFDAAQHTACYLEKNRIMFKSHEDIEAIAWSISSSEGYRKVLQPMAFAVHATLDVFSSIDPRWLYQLFVPIKTAKHLIINTNGTHFLLNLPEYIY